MFFNNRVENIALAGGGGTLAATVDIDRKIAHSTPKICMHIYRRTKDFIRKKNLIEKKIRFQRKMSSTFATT